MCGLAALIGESDPALVSKLLDRQAHRGPDGQGVLDLDGLGTVLGHCRLAIIDPEGGAQPLTDKGSGASLVANGMIYNDRELRSLMSQATFTTGSDSESILHLISREGAPAAEQLDGMFAFVMHKDGRILAGRDPIGIKPLYIGAVGDSTVFASEARALDGIAEGIREFPPGHVFDSAFGLARYYAVPEPSNEPVEVGEAMESLRRTLEQAVVKRLRSDVPFGCFLSGGLDSSIIAALAARHLREEQGKRLRTFAVGMEGSADILAARLVAEHIGSEHTELVLTRALVEEALPKIVSHLESFDRDLVRSAVPCWFVAQHAAEEVKVVLTGEGADELFAGYDYYRGYEDPEELQAELKRSIESMHNINLQRVDRMTMAHGLEARVPFLDVAMIELAMGLPAPLKLRREEGEVTEKWILRKAFEDLLPEEIVWRGKVQFDQGSGLSDLLQTIAADRGEDEEGLYRDYLQTQASDAGQMLGLVAHWRERPAA